MLADARLTAKVRFLEGGGQFAVSPCRYIHVRQMRGHGDSVAGEGKCIHILVMTSRVGNAKRSHT